jgi:transcriptional regulator with XRE-family HTH domain
MEDSPWSDFGEWLQRARRRQGLSQANLAELMGCTQNYIWRLEKGKRHPSKEFL